MDEKEVLRQVVQANIELEKQVKTLVNICMQQVGQIAALQFGLQRVIELLPVADQGKVSVNVDLKGALMFKDKPGAGRDAFIGMRDALIQHPDHPRPPY